MHIFISLYIYHQIDFATALMSPNSEAIGERYVTPRQSVGQALGVAVIHKLISTRGGNAWSQIGMLRLNKTETLRIDMNIGHGNG
jgi:hypothetical protein